MRFNTISILYMIHEVDAIHVRILENHQNPWLVIIITKMLANLAVSPRQSHLSSQWCNSWDVRKLSYV